MIFHNDDGILRIGTFPTNSHNLVKNHQFSATKYLFKGSKKEGNKQ